MGQFCKPSCNPMGRPRTMFGVPRVASWSKNLAHGKSIRNLQKYFIYPNQDTCYANSSNFGTSCTVLATVPNRIRNFDFFFSECIPWTHTQLWVPQTWSSVKPLDHKKAYKTVPLQILLSVHLTRQYMALAIPFNLHQIFAWP